MAFVAGKIVKGEREIGHLEAARMCVCIEEQERRTFVYMCVCVCGGGMEHRLQTPLGFQKCLNNPHFPTGVKS